MAIITAVIWLLIYLLVLGLIGWLVIWVLGLIGVPVPQRVIQIVGAIIFLIVLLWFLSAVLGGAHFPTPNLK